MICLAEMVSAGHSRSQEDYEWQGLFCYLTS